MGAAAGIGADQHPPPQLAGQLGQRQPGDLGVFAGDVRSGVAPPQHDRQGFAARSGGVVSGRGQGVEPKRLPRRCRERAITIVASSPPGSATRPRLAPGHRLGPGVLAGRGQCFADRTQRQRGVRGQGGDQSGHRWVGGHRPANAGCARSTAISARQSLPQHEYHDDVSNDLPRAMDRPRGAPPGQPSGQGLAQPGDPGSFCQQ
jgi:hypothetical protein